MAFHGFQGKDQSNKKRYLLPLFTLHDFMFSEKKVKKVMKSIEDSFEYTQRSNEFEQIHNTPEKIMKYADTIVAEIEKKERLLSKRKPKQLVFVDEDSIRTESQFHHPVSYFAPHSPEIADNEEELSDSHSFDEQIHAMNENIGGNVADNTSEVEMVEKLQNQETYFHAYLGLKKSTVISNSLRASRLGRMIPILPVPLPENTYRVVVKWRLRVLLDQHRDHTHRILLRHFLQGHVEDTVNADLDSLLDVMFRRLESVNSSTFIKKKGGKKIGWHALVIDHSNVKFARSFVDEVWPSNQCDRIKHLNIFLPKVADAMKTVHLIIDDDFMLQIEGTLSSKIFLLNLSFLPDQFFGTKDCPFLDLSFKQILGQLRNDEATNSLIKNTFGSKTILCRDCYRQMTGKVMSLIAYGAFTDKMVISNTLLSNNIDMFWKTLSMVIPGSVLQSLVSDATYVRKSMPHTCTLLHTAVNHSNVPQEPHFGSQ